MKDDKKKRLIKKSLAVSDKPGTVHVYDCKALKERHKSFHARKQHAIRIHTEGYVPNPWVCQYDLEFDIFLNYKQIKEEALSLAGSSEERDFINEFGPTGLKAHEHLLNAAAIRWPTVKQDGVWSGKLIQHPWLTKQWEQLTDYTFLIVFGGGGQGKTHGFAAFLSMLFDHFIGTELGAKCSFSTVNEDKLKNAIWPYVSQRLYPVPDSRPKFSLYAGKGRVGSDYTVFRFGDKSKDTGGVMKGVLVGSSVNDSVIVDKLTGSHGHMAMGYLMDEMQSTQRAPMAAAQNYLSTPIYKWVFGAGNYGEDGDLLGDNAEPLDGWNSVTDQTGEWEAMTTTGHIAKIIHQNNDFSPAMLSKTWAKRCSINGKCWLPNPDRKQELYPSPESRRTPEYRRFWIGFRDLEVSGNFLITQQLIEQNGAYHPPEFDVSREVRHHISFDCAQMDVDRNILLHFADGYCSKSKRWIWAPIEIINIPLQTHSLNYYRESCEFIVKYCAENGIPSGNGIMDWSNRTSHVETLRDMGFDMKVMSYGVKCPDGKTADKRVRQIEPPLLLEPHPTDHTKSKYAHTECENLIGLGGWLLRQYIIFRRVTNLNKMLIERLRQDGLSKTWEREILSREFEYRTSSSWGDRFALCSKKDFIKQYRFSPDILDTLLQAAYYMLKYRGMTPSDLEFLPKSLRRRIGDPHIPEKVNNESEEEIEEHLNLWSYDSIPDGF